MDLGIGLGIENAVAPAVAYGITEALKKSAGDKAWFKRILPLLPAALCFGLAFIPGLGLAAAPIGTKILFAAAAGGLANSAYSVKKHTLKIGSKK